MALLTALSGETKDAFGMSSVYHNIMLRERSNHLGFWFHCIWDVTHNAKQFHSNALDDRSFTSEKERNSKSRRSRKRQRFHRQFT